MTRSARSRSTTRPAVDHRRAAALRAAMDDLGSYAADIAGRPLRPYQLEPGRAILKAVAEGQGGTFSVQMSRQAGKNELSAQLEAYLLTLHRSRGGSIVKCAPTYRPQVLTSLMRLKDALASPLSEVTPVEPEHGYVVRLRKARAFFLSAEPEASVVGATASLLLEVDEAQDVSPDKHDRDFAPMAAANDAVRVYYGTAGTAGDLLDRVKTDNLEAEKKDGLKRHFAYPWWVVAEHNPAYGRFVERERNRLGASHPVFLSQYELKPVSPVDALLDERQLRSMRGDHPRQERPGDPYATYVAGVDVAGGAELAPDPFSPRPDRDSTVVTVAEVDTAHPGGRLVRVVRVYELTGENHLAQHERFLRLLADTWGVRAVAFDASGLGRAPCELLRARMGTRVQPVVFTAQSKSELGYDLLSAANAGLLKMYRADPDDREANAFWAQLAAVRRSINPGGTMAWAAPRGHDDYATSLALCLRAAHSAYPPPFLAMIPPVERYHERSRY